MLHQKKIQLSNKKCLYRMISENPGISRAELAVGTHLSKTTVSSLVEQLIQDEYIVDAGCSKRGIQGRSPNDLHVDAERNCVVVCNLRKKVLQLAVVSTAYEVETIIEIALPEGSVALTAIIAPVREFILAESANRRVAGVCMIIPGIIDSKREEIISVVLPVRDAKDLIGEFRRNLSDLYPVAIFNDTSCFAYAENAFGDIGFHDYIYININEGVGASFVQDGNLVTGASGMGTQFGHLSIRRDGVPCVCGNHGCLENYIGESVLKSRIIELGILGEFANPERILFKDVGRLAEAGSEGALKLIATLAEDLSYGLGNLLTLFHLEKVVIGGMGRNLGRLYLAEVQRQVRLFGFRHFTRLVDIEFTRLNEDALFTGAAKYYMDQCYEFNGVPEGGLYI